MITLVWYRPFRYANVVHDGFSSYHDLQARTSRPLAGNAWLAAWVAAGAAGPPAWGDARATRKHRAGPARARPGGLRPSGMLSEPQPEPCTECALGRQKASLAGPVWLGEWRPGWGWGCGTGLHAPCQCGRGVWLAVTDSGSLARRIPSRPPAPGPGPADSEWGDFDKVWPSRHSLRPWLSLTEAGLAVLENGIFCVQSSSQGDRDCGWVNQDFLLFESIFNITQINIFFQQY